MNKLLNLKTVLIVTIFLVYSKQHYAQSQFLKLGENANTISLSHDFSFAGLSTLKYTKSFSGKLDTYLSLGYASIDQGDFGSPGRINYYLPSIGLDYFLFKKDKSPFSASLGLEYTRVSSNIGDPTNSLDTHVGALKAQAFYRIPIKNFDLVAFAGYYHRFDLENLRNNVGEYEFGLSTSVPLKNNKKINLGLSVIGTRNFDPSLRLTVGFTF